MAKRPAVSNSGTRDSDEKQPAEAVLLLALAGFLGSPLTFVARSRSTVMSALRQRYLVAEIRRFADLDAAAFCHQRLAYPSLLHLLHSR